MATPQHPTCETCEKPLVSWPWRHQGYRGAAGPQVSSPKVGEQYACQTPLCNRYGLVLRIAVGDPKPPPRPPLGPRDCHLDVPVRESAAKRLPSPGKEAATMASTYMPVVRTVAASVRVR